MAPDLLADVRYALRQLKRSPGFALIAILALGLGIGANTAIFSAVNALLIQALPYPEANRLVMVWEDASYAGFPRNTPAPANFLDWRKRNQVFSDMAAIRNTGANLTDGGNAEMVLGVRATPNLFNVLKVQPLMGRTWSEKEEQENASVIVISHRLWQRRYAGDPNIVGKTTQVNGETQTIVGVMPPGFAFPDREREFFIPTGLTPQRWTVRGSHFLQVVARLKPGVPIERASADMETIAKQLQQEHPEDNTKVGARVVPLREDMLGDTRPQLLILIAAAGCVLLIACANVANLLLARASARRREMAVRTALGASNIRLLRQTLTESLVLALSGGITGLAFAAGIRGLNGLIPRQYAGASEVSLDWRVLVVTLLIALCTGLVFGMAPALTHIRLAINDTLRQGDRGAAGFRGNGLRSGLVMGEIALSLLLLVTTGLLLQTLFKLRGLESGFRTDHLLLIRTSLAQPRFREDARRIAFMDEVVRRMKTIPGVERAALVSTLPFESIGNTNGFAIEGRPPADPGNNQDSLMRVATSEYLPLLGVRLKQGRLFDSSDRADSPYVVVINEMFAKTFWPNESPLGKRIRFGDPSSPWATVIGVVGDVRERGFERPMKFGAYTLQSQNTGWGVGSLVLRTNVDPMSVVPSVRKVLNELDPELPLARIRTMQDLMDLQLAQRDQQMYLLASFAALALILASIGLYGVLSYVVAQRTREIGIRMALGAGVSNVVAEVLQHGAALALAGIVIGSLGALALARAFQSLLFGVTPSDPGTFLGVGALLMLIALFACFMPARRAASVDPAIVLREE